MPTTPKRSHPYPSASAVPDVPYDLQRLAETLDEDTYAALKAPTVMLGRTTGQQTATATQAQVTFPQQSLDGAPHVTWSATNPGRIIVNTEGIYAVTCYALWGTNANGARALGFRALNAGTYTLYDARAAAPISTAITCSGDAWLMPGTYEVIAYQSSGGNLDITRADAVVRWVRYPPMVGGTTPAVVLR